MHCLWPSNFLTYFYLFLYIPFHSLPMTLPYFLPYTFPLSMCCLWPFLTSSLVFSYSSSSLSIVSASTYFLPLPLQPLACISPSPRPNVRSLHTSGTPHPIPVLAWCIPHPPLSHRTLSTPPLTYFIFPGPSFFPPYYFLVNATPCNPKIYNRIPPTLIIMFKTFLFFVVNIFNRDIFWIFFYVLYSTLLHLPYIRCARGC